jgi:hypothetical protein
LRCCAPKACCEPPRCNIESMSMRMSMRIARDAGLN